MAAKKLVKKIRNKTTTKLPDDFLLFDNLNTEFFELGNHQLKSITLKASDAHLFTADDTNGNRKKHPKDVLSLDMKYGYKEMKDGSRKPIEYNKFGRTYNQIDTLRLHYCNVPNSKIESHQKVLKQRHPNLLFSVKEIITIDIHSGKECVWTYHKSSVKPVRYSLICYSLDGIMFRFLNYRNDIIPVTGDLVTDACEYKQTKITKTDIKSVCVPT